MREVVIRIIDSSINTHSGKCWHLERRLYKEVMNYNPTRHQHCLINTSRSYYYFNYLLRDGFSNFLSSKWTVLKPDGEARWFSQSKALFSAFCLF